MNLFNRDTDYAIRALCEMARRNPDDIVTVTELSSCLKVPRPYLRRILQTLAHAGILGSFRGKFGGFRLILDPGKIPLKEVYEQFQGPFNLTECLFHGKLCPNHETCLLRQTLKTIEHDAQKTLRQTTIASLIASTGGNATARNQRAKLHPNGALRKSKL